MLAELYDKRMNRGKSVDSLTLIAQFYSCVEQYDSVYVLFDAFDECDGDQQGSMVSVMLELLRPPSLKIMITCRHHLQSLQTISELALVLEIKAYESDIQRYIWTRLEKVRHLSQDLKKTIVDIVTRGAEGM